MSRHLMRLALAGSNLARDASAGEWALAQPTLAQGFLAAFGAKSDPVRVAAVDGALTLLADRGLDSAAAATRAAAGGGAEVHLSLGAGLCALTIEGLSPHLATEQRASLLDAIELPERAATEIRARMARRERIHGFCGPDDPVVRRLLALARELAPQKQPLRVLRALIDTADVAGLPAPGMGWGLLALAIALEVGRDGAIALLALGRSAGLIAHALEQRDLGPLGVRARYVGAPMHTTDGLP